MLPILTPILLELARNGLSVLANAILAKGKDAVEKTLGVTIPDESTTQLSEEKLVELKMAEMEHEATLLAMSLETQKLTMEQDRQANEAITQRWQADMLSDSWLAKNVRPMVLIYILGAYTIFAVASAFDVNVKPAYVELMAQWGMLIMSAYFVGRSVEKVVIAKTGGDDVSSNG